MAAAEITHRQSPTIHQRCPYFPVFSSPTATIEVVGNTGTMSSEKPDVDYSIGSSKSRRGAHSSISFWLGIIKYEALWKESLRSLTHQETNNRSE